jgi:hypothetical protein
MEKEKGGLSPFSLLWVAVKVNTDSTSVFLCFSERALPGGASTRRVEERGQWSCLIVQGLWKSSLGMHPAKNSAMRPTCRHSRRGSSRDSLFRCNCRNNRRDRNNPADNCRNRPSNARRIRRCSSSRPRNLSCNRPRRGRPLGRRRRREDYRYQSTGPHKFDHGNLARGSRAGSTGRSRDRSNRHRDNSPSPHKDAGITD